MSIIRWWEVDPSRFEDELTSLRAAGLYPVVNEQMVESTGYMIIDVKFHDHVANAAYDLRIVFPAEYSFFPPFVYAISPFPPGRHLGKGGELCLLHEANSMWNRAVDNAASLIMEQAPKILLAHKTPDKIATFEANAGTQVDAYFDYEPGSLILTDQIQCPIDINGGMIELQITSPNADPVRGTVEKVFDDKGNVLFGMDPRVAQRWLIGEKLQRYKFPWFKLGTPPSYANPQAIVAAIVSRYPHLAKRFPKSSPKGMTLVAIMYPVEVKARKHEYTWLLVKFRAQRKDAPPSQSPIGLVRCDHIGRETMQSRAPRLASLAKKKAALIGVGAIGSTVATQLARAGVGNIALVDFDIVTAGNIVRWAGGLPALGKDKSLQMAEIIHRDFPYTDAMPAQLKLGEPTADLTGQYTRLGEALEDTDIIVDASASRSVNDYLAAMAKSMRVPYVWATGTPGCYGGVVGRALPDRECGCYYCYRFHRRDKSIRIPASDPNDDMTVQPVGCFDPTFTGTGFDMDQISIMCARMVIATLCRGSDQGYPDFDWDVGVVDLWDQKLERPIEPRWTPYRLEIHPECTAHG